MQDKNRVRWGLHRKENVMGSSGSFSEVGGLTLSREMPRTNVTPSESGSWEVKWKRLRAHNQNLEKASHLGEGSYPLEKKGKKGR